jgi:hypothetical protein
MEKEEEQFAVHRPYVPCKSNQGVCIEVVDHLCGVMVSHGVLPTLLRYILLVPELSTI